MARGPEKAQPILESIDLNKAFISKPSIIDNPSINEAFNKSNSASSIFEYFEDNLTEIQMYVIFLC